MANNRNKNRRFGLAGGKHTSKRMLKRYGNVGRNCLKHVKQKARKHGSYIPNVLLMREKILQRYNIMSRRKSLAFKQLFVNTEFQDRYNIQKIVRDDPNTSTGLKYKFNRVNSRENDGYRLLSLNLLQEFLKTITLHTVKCKPLMLMVRNSSCESPVKLIREVRNCGLASIFIAQCQGCGNQFRFETSPQLPLNGTRHYDVNVRTVWGTMVTGSGVSNINELMGTINAPGMSQPTFSAIEQEIGDLWGNCVEEDLLAAGAEERERAIDKGSYDDGVPAITVVADGGWSKRSHKHTYNALGGVGVILGAETGKVLHIGVRNKHCYICNKAETNHTTPPPHRCFKNWSQSSQAMEADIVVEGFSKAEQLHGLRYTQLIADGDSSVFAKIQEQVPVWGKKVRKKECANHVCKCLRTNLEKLVESNAHYKGKGRLTKSARVKIVNAVRGAIRFRSQESDKTKAATKLEKDIRNSVHHVFGNHKNCSEFCKATGVKVKLTKLKENDINYFRPNSKKDETVSDTFGTVSQIWLDSNDIDKEEEARGDCEVDCELDSIMIRDISVLLDRVAVKSKQLLGNSTTNLAESWMAIRSKFDGGKLYNRCNRGSWHTRCYGGVLRKNLGSKWSPKIWEKTTSTKAGKCFEKVYEVRESAHVLTKLSQQKPERKAKRWKRKMESSKESNSKKAKMEYGETALQPPPDISAERLEESKNNFLDTHINLNDDKLAKIERMTREQSATAVWHDERKKRITSSNFGAICKRNPNLKVTPIVKRMIYPTFKGNIYTRTGIQSEAMTIKEYKCRKEEENCPVEVQLVGLVICKQQKYLASSPDGKVIQANGDVGLLEIKNLLQNKPLNLYEAAKNTNFCLESVKKKLQLKRNHDYFYQIQGQMNVCELPWTDFIVRTENPYQLHIERIKRDASFWRENMLPKLQGFYLNVILPELAVPTFNTTTGIREPGNWVMPCIAANDYSTTVKDNRKKKGTRCNAPNNPRDPTDRIPVTAASPQPSTSVSTHNAPNNTRDPTDRIPVTAASPQPSTSVSTHIRSRRQLKVKFLGRRIAHEWIDDEEKQTTKWFNGTVVSVISGKDGEPNVTYEILYDGEDEPYSVDHLYQDFQTSSVKFIDLWYVRFDLI